MDVVAAQKPAVAGFFQIAKVVGIPAVDVCPARLAVFVVNAGALQATAWQPAQEGIIPPFCHRVIIMQEHFVPYP